MRVEDCSLPAISEGCEATVDWSMMRAEASFFPRVCAACTIALCGAWLHRGHTRDAAQEEAYREDVGPMPSPPRTDEPVPRYEKYVHYVDPPCRHYFESCECEGRLFMLMSEPPQHICDGIETCENTNRFVPDGCEND